MIIYLAARYSRNAEMRERRDFFRRWGYEVTSRWIDRHPDDDGVPQLQSSFTPEVLATTPDVTQPFAEVDLEDLDRADTVISFTEGPRGVGGKGGRHVEFGYAVAAGKQLVLVGPREHVFHTLPRVKQFDTWEEFERVFAMSHSTLGDLSASDH